MKKFVRTRLLCAAIAAGSALQLAPVFAAARPSAISTVEPQGARNVTRGEVEKWRIGQSIVLRKAVELPLESARDARGSAVQPTKPVLFASGSEMSVLSVSTGPDGEPLVELGLDFDGEVDSEGQPLYPQITVRADLLLRGSPQPVTGGLALLGEDVSLSPIGSGQTVAVNSDEVDVAVEVAGRGRVAVRKGKIPGHRRTGMTYCYRNVKNYLMQKCDFPVYLPGESAISSVETLPKFGFNRISENFEGFESMPACTVCVLSGGTHICSNGQPCGDVVVKTVDGQGWLGWKPRATPYLDGRTPVGCFYRPPGTPVPVNPEIVSATPTPSPTPEQLPTAPPAPVQTPGSPSVN